MISRAANRAALQAIPQKEQPVDRNANTSRGHGFHEKLPNKASRKRYYDRQHGKIPPLEYGTLDQALEALS